MNFPEIVDPASLASAKAPASTIAGVAAGDPGTMDMWEYFVDHIDEFPVAKSIVDHFEANPRDLVNPKIEVDVYALYLRAKVTLKRDQVAFAATQAAVTAAQAAATKAREESRGLRGAARAVSRYCNALRLALLAEPLVVAMAVASAAYCLTR